MSRRTSRSSRRRTSRSMRPNVLVLANPLGQPMNPLYKTTLREAVAQARMELQELREGKAPAEETFRAYRKLNNLERKLFLARKAGFTRQSDPGTLTAMEEYLSDSNAARGLPSEEFESWSTGRLRRNGLEPNVLLLPNPSRQYDIAPEYAAQQVAAAREEYNRIMKESSTLRLEDPIGNGDRIDKLERRLRELGKRIQFYVKFTGPTGKKMAQHLRKTSKGRAGLPSKKFEKWSMEPNVLLLPNPGAWNPFSADGLLEMFDVDMLEVSHVLDAHERSGGRDLAALAHAIDLLGGLRQIKSLISYTDLDDTHLENLRRRFDRAESLADTYRRRLGWG